MAHIPFEKLPNWPMAMTFDQALAYTGLGAELLRAHMRRGSIRFLPIGPNRSNIVPRWQLDEVLHSIWVEHRLLPSEDFDFGDDAPTPRRQPTPRVERTERCGITEASRITGLSRRTLQDLARNIPGASKPAGRWLFDIKKLRAWAARVTPPKRPAYNPKALRPAGRVRVKRLTDVADAYEQALGLRPRKE